MSNFKIIQFGSKNALSGTHRVFPIRIPMNTIWCVSSFLIPCNFHSTTIWSGWPFLTSLNFNPMFSLQNVNFEYRVNRMLYPTLTYPPDIYIQFGEKKVWFVGPRGLNSVGETEKGETHYALCFLLVRALKQNNDASCSLVLLALGILRLFTSRNSWFQLLNHILQRMIPEKQRLTSWFVTPFTAAESSNTRPFHNPYHAHQDGPCIKKDSDIIIMVHVTKYRTPTGMRTWN